MARITLEDSKGKVVQNPRKEQIRETIFNVGEGIDHCMLSVEGKFIQTAGKKNELFVEADLGSGSIVADRADYSPEDVYQMFMGFLNDDDTWKDHFTTSSFSGPSDFSRSHTPTEQGKKPKFDVKAEAGKALQQEGKYVARRQMRRGIRGVLSLITGLFIKNKLRK